MNTVILKTLTSKTYISLLWKISETKTTTNN